VNLPSYSTVDVYVCVLRKPRCVLLSATPLLRLTPMHVNARWWHTTDG